MWQDSDAVGTPPAGHIYYNTNPSFRLYDINGNPEPLNAPYSSYSSVNPVLPQVHTHLNNVVNDIATRYNVDGVHLDYIRYIPGANNAAANFDTMPHDPIAHQMFQQATGLDAGNIANFNAYKSYITGRITDLVASLKQTVDAAEVSEGREILLNASVWRDPDVGKNDYMQDYRTWIANDLLDVAMPMIYLSSANDDTLFAANLANSLNIPTSNTRVAPTIAAYLHTTSGGGVALTTAEMKRAYNMGADGLGFYDYTAMFNDSLASQRLAAMDSFYDSIPTLPKGVGNVLDNFESSEGRFTTNPIGGSGTTQGVLAGSTANRVTSEHQTGAAGQQISIVGSSGGWTLRHLSGGGTPANNASLAATGFLGFWLKTDDPGVSVKILLDEGTALETPYVKAVIPDNQWHLYQWNLEDDGEWFNFSGGNGTISSATVTLDSILFTGAGNATLYLDNVSHNPTGYLAAPPIAGDFNGDGNVDQDDLLAWKTGFGMPSGALAQHGDGDNDGDVDGSDFLVWQRNLGSAQTVPAAAANVAAVPEPGTVALMLAALAALAARSRR
jgi:hypothetical protein